MIQVTATDSFLYQGRHVNTGNKINVTEADIPKLIAAGKISPEHMPDITEEQARQKYGKPPDQVQPDKFLTQAPKPRKKSKKY